MDINKQASKIRYRKKSKDIFYTPEDLAIKCVGLVPLVKGDSVLDPAKGKGVFVNNFPTKTINYSFDIAEGIDFFKMNDKVDWIITNPPYSLLGEWLEHSCKVCRKGFAYLIGSYSITPKRLDLIKSYGFKLTHMHICKVSTWFGMTTFCIFEKNTAAEKINFTYDRKVYQSKEKYSREDNLINKITLMNFIEDNEK